MINKSPHIKSNEVETSNSSYYTTLHGESLMVAYLMEAGWELHVNRDATIQPQLRKMHTVGNISTISAVLVSHNVVLDLQQAAVIKKRCEFGHGSKRQTIYKWSV